VNIIIFPPVCYGDATKQKMEEVNMTTDEKWMRQAIKQAKKAEKLEEVPIGCVIVHNDKIIARGYNRRNTDHTSLAHAEMMAIKKACKKIGDWRLEECTLYVTLEPCQMCAGAIVQSRVKRVVIGAMNKKAGCAGSIFNLLEEDRFNHKAEVTRGILEDECAEMMSEFFRGLRAKKSHAFCFETASQTVPK
jgi:hypothetical protein